MSDHKPKVSVLSEQTLYFRRPDADTGRDYHMNITGLTLKNFKGISGTWKFSPLTLIVGANFSGKSALIDGIRVGLLGYHPDLGRRNADTFELSSGDHMQVDIEIDNAPGISRQWQRSMKGDAHTIKEHSQYSCPLRFDDLPMLDPKLYFGLSDKERTDYIFQRSKGSTTPDDILEKLQEVMDENEDVTTWDETAFEEIKARFIDILEDASIHAGVNQINDWLSESYTNWNRLARERSGAAQELNRITAAKPEFYQRKDALLDEEIETNARIAKLSQQIGAAGAIQEQNRSIQERRNQIAEYLKTPLEDEPKAPKKPKSIPSEKDISEAIKRLSDTEGLFLSAMQRKHQNETARADFRSQLEQLHSQSRCPHCLSSEAGWKKNLEAGILESISLLGDDSEIDALIEKYKYYAGIQSEELRKMKAEAEKLTAYNLALCQYNSAVKARELVVKRRLEMACELETLKTLEEQDVSELESSRKALQVNRDDVSRMLRAIDRWDTEMALSNKAVAGLREAESWVKTIKSAQTKISAVKAELIDSVFSSITDPANRIGGALLPSEIKFHDGCIGRFDGSRFIKYFTFSGTEQSITFASIAAALSMSFPFRILLLDEMGVMTASTQSQLLASFSAAVERGDLHQVICVIPREKPISLANWSIITTTK